MDAPTNYGGPRFAVEGAFEHWAADGSEIIGRRHLEALVGLLLGPEVPQAAVSHYVQLMFDVVGAPPTPAGDRTALGTHGAEREGLAFRAFLNHVFEPHVLFPQSAQQSAMITPPATVAEELSAPGLIAALPQETIISKQDSEVLGVSVAWMETGFLDALDAVFGAHADPDYHSLAERLLTGPSGLGAGRICPRDGALHCSYVDALDSRYTGRSTVMISAPLEHSVRDVVGSISSWCKENALDSSQTYVWQCSMCNNLYRTGAREQETLHNAAQASYVELLEKRLRAIGRVLVFLSPWQKPVYLHSALRLFELYMALRTEGVCLDVVFPDGELQPFLDAFGLQEIHPTWAAFGAVDFGRAAAAAKRGEGAPEANAPFPSFPADVVNDMISQCLCRWLAGGAARKLDACFRVGQQVSLQTCVNIAWMLMQVNDWSGATHTLALGLDLNLQQTGVIVGAGGAAACQRAGGETNGFQPRGPSDCVLRPLALHSLGLCLGAQGSHEQAVRFYQEAKSAYCQAEAEGSFEYVSLLRSLAARLRSRRRLGEAVALYQEASAICEMPNVTNIVGYGPFVKGEICDVAEISPAMCDTTRNRPRAESVRSRADSVRHSGCSEEPEQDTPRDISDSEDGYPSYVREHCSSFPDGSQILFSSRCSTITEKSPRAPSDLDDPTVATALAYANLLASMALCLGSQGRHEEAMALYCKAKVAYEEAGATRSCEYGDILRAMASRLHACGQQDEAAQLYGEARAICEALDDQQASPKSVAAAAAKADPSEQFPTVAAAAAAAAAAATAAAAAATAAAATTGSSTQGRAVEASPLVDSRLRQTASSWRDGEQEIANFVA